MHDDVASMEREHIGVKAPGAELREAMMASVGFDDVVPGLRSPVPAQNGLRPDLTDEVVGDEPLAAIAEAEIADDEGLAAIRPSHGHPCSTP